MRLSIIFVSAILITGQVAWAETSQKPSARELLADLQPPAVPVVEKIISDVVNGKVTVKPSMIPPEIFDRIYRVEEADKILRAAGAPKAELFIYIGYMAAMRDLLYILGITSRPMKLPLQYDPPMDEFVVNEGLAITSIERNRMRLITTMLLLLDYKEANPIPPGDIVQVTISK